MMIIDDDLVLMQNTNILSKYTKRLLTQPKIRILTIENTTNNPIQIEAILSLKSFKNDTTQERQKLTRKEQVNSKAYD